MDRWVYSARLILVYRLVGHHWSLDGMLKVRQFFTCKGRLSTPAMLSDTDTISTIPVSAAVGSARHQSYGPASLGIFLHL